MLSTEETLLLTTACILCQILYSTNADLFALHNHYAAIPFVYPERTDENVHVCTHRIF